MYNLSNYFFYVLVFILILNCGCEKNDGFQSKKPSPKIMDDCEDIFVDNMFRMGPVLFKFDKEWLIEENEKKFLYIALNKKGYETDGLISNYEQLSLKSKSVSVSNKVLHYEELWRTRGTQGMDYEVDVYKIPCTDTEMWIDLNLVISTRYSKSTNVNEIRFQYAKSFFFYHPIQKKWWGIHYNFGPEELTRILFSDLYDDKNTSDDIKNLLSKVSENKTKEDIINKRTLVLPPVKFYEEKYSQFNDSNKMFCWYKEKEEVAPKDKDE